MAARKTKSRKTGRRKATTSSKKRTPRKKSAPRKKKRQGRPAPGERRGDKTLAERLIAVRERYGLTRVTVSAETGINYESLSGYELGLEHPPFRRVRLLAIYYRVSLDYFAGITDLLTIRKSAHRKRR